MIEIIVTIIGVCGGIITALISAKAMSKKVVNEVQQQLVTHQAVTDTKLEELTREVREHNNFAKRMPVVENEISHIENDMIKDIKADISELKKFHQGGN